MIYNTVGYVAMALLCNCIGMTYAAVAVASAQASVDTSVEPDQHYEEYPGHLDMSRIGQMQKELTVNEMVHYLRVMIASEVERRPDLYDEVDVSKILESGNKWHTIRFLEQRSYNLERAFRLAVNTLRWRRTYEVSSLRAEYFPCDLFRLGIIFEHGISNDISHEGLKYPGVPIIWLRLGALGRVVERLERFTPKKVASNSVKLLRATATTTLKILERLSSGPRQVEVIESPEMRLSKNGPAAQHPALNFILRSIVWWLEDWEERHGHNTEAMLVMDFENTGGVFSSDSMSDFIIGLDDRFPGLFSQIIGFRHKTNMFSVNMQTQLFNKLFRSRALSSVETDAKLRYVSARDDLVNYMPTYDEQGFDLLPGHIRGDCAGFYKEFPVGCNPDTIDFEMSAPFDVRELQAVKSEFYSKCNARTLSLMNPRNKF